MITDTSEGGIAYKLHPSLQFMMPVKLLITDGKVVMRGERPVPMKQDGKYVYALPGGGNYVI